MTETAPSDVAAERAVLDSVGFLGGNALILLHQIGLREDHFYYCAPAFRAALDVHDRGEPVDYITVPALAEFAGLGHATQLEAHAKRVMHVARWRNVHRAGLVLMEAVGTEDEEGLAYADSLLQRSEHGDNVWTRDRLGDLMLERLERKATPGWEMPLGIRKRLQRGNVWLVGAWTSHGKTVFVDQIARCVNDQGAKVWAYINEMTAEERICRHAASVTGIDLQRIEENDLAAQEKTDVALAMRSVPFAIVECPGWSAEEIARDFRARKADVVVIDILHEIPYDTERDLGRIMRTLTAAAKLAGVAVVATVHLNRNRIQSAARPVPTMGDIKGASAFEQGADVVVMVWREDDDVTGKPKDNGLITLLKIRQGKPEGVPVLLRGSIATFVRDLTYG